MPNRCATFPFAARLAVLAAALAVPMSASAAVPSASDPFAGLPRDPSAAACLRAFVRAADSALAEPRSGAPLNGIAALSAVDESRFADRRFAFAPDPAQADARTQAARAAAADAAGARADWARSLSEGLGRRLASEEGAPCRALSGPGGPAAASAIEAWTNRAESAIRSVFSRGAASDAASLERAARGPGFGWTSALVRSSIERDGRWVSAELSRMNASLGRMADALDGSRPRR